MIVIAETCLIEFTVGIQSLASTKSITFLKRF